MIPDFITNQTKFIKFMSKLILPVTLLAIISLVLGVSQALYFSPLDYQQGEYVRIMYVHVPSAWMSLAIYMFATLCSFIFICTGNVILNIISREIAPIGATFAFITLVTGSIWGKPTWGTWWAWDARMTFMLILFFFYIAYFLLVRSINRNLHSKLPSVLIIAGAVNVPIIKFSVEMWNSLHQPASIIRIGGNAIHKDMMLPLILMFIFSICLSYIIFYFRFQNLINSRTSLKFHVLNRPH